VMRAEEKRIDCGPVQAKGNRLENDVVRHGSSVEA
jgi:hypothetical protein